MQGNPKRFFFVFCCILVILVGAIAAEAYPVYAVLRAELATGPGWSESTPVR